ncbi:MAG TPA: Ig-like domain-containing protein [Solirubrobacteraceae bacterium]|nr:Ig-like domain-containing protein [Solirubrobacteraceae bacterium]
MKGFGRAAALLLFAAAAGTATSGATYTASSDNPQTFGAAADFGLSVTMQDPGSPMRGTKTLSATPTVTDGVPVASVVIERAVAGSGSWTAVCTDSAAPYDCSLDTTTLANGAYDLRARATNTNGYTRISTTVGNRLVDNAAPSATLTAPAAWFRGTLTLDASASDTGGSGLATVRYERRPSSGGTWTTACTASASPWSCAFDTTVLTDGTAYDFRAVATDGAGNETISTLTNRRPDNTIPGGSLTDPGTNRRGTIAIAFGGTDAHSGVASVAVQYTTAGGSSWSTGCVDTSTPFDGCSWDTTPLDSVFDLRVVVTDTAGNTFTTPTIANRRIDNGLPTVPLSAPTSPMSGSITLSSNAVDSGSGIASVTFQYSNAGAGTWGNACAADTAVPYECVANSAAVADGLYDFRAIGADVAGNTAIGTLTNQRIDNFAPSGSDVQTYDGGGTQGVIQTGDSIVLTYSEAMDPASIVSGWNGTGSQSIHVRFAHHNQGDRLTFYDSANTNVLPLGATNAVVLGEDYVPGSGATYAATLTRSASGAAFTIVLGARTAGSVNAAAPPAATARWTPAAAALDLVGKACSTTARNETGTADVEF